MKKVPSYIVGGTANQYNNFGKQYEDSSENQEWGMEARWQISGMWLFSQLCDSGHKQQENNLFVKWVEKKHCTNTQYWTMILEDWEVWGTSDKDMEQNWSWAPG